MFYRQLLANLSKFYTYENLGNIQPMKTQEGKEANGGILVDLHRMDKRHARMLVRNIITCMPHTGTILVMHGKGKGILRKAIRKIKHPRILRMVIPRNPGITFFDIE